ncbi:MAG: DUF4956 domain-containing protein [Spirosomaceae bacterium]|nr:DUF4956 domain-containing protein [Spirosomataceae bacterium]
MLEQVFSQFIQDKTIVVFISRLLINIFSLVVIVRFVYFKNYQRTDLFLTFFGINIIIFLITFLLNSVEMSMGAAFGLFAVFSMLRYRTEGIAAKDVTYIFIVIAIGLISAVSQYSFINFILIAIIWVLESGYFVEKEYSKNIIYDKIELIKPENRPALLDDLRSRTGLSIHRVEINDCDFLKDSSQLTVFYKNQRR